MKAIIFDFDGTLLDSNYVWESLIKEYVSLKGFTYNNKTHDEIMHIFDNYELFNYLIRSYNVSDDIETINKEFNSLYDKEYEKTKLKPYVKETLEYLKKNNVKIAIATCTNKLMVIHVLKREGILEYFEVIESCYDYKISKNIPYIFDKCVEELKVNKEDVIIIDDSNISISTARSVGYNTIGLKDRYNLEEDWEEIKQISTYHAQSFYEILEIIKSC